MLSLPTTVHQRVVQAHCGRSKHQAAFIPDASVGQESVLAERPSTALIGTLFTCCVLTARNKRKLIAKVSTRRQAEIPGWWQSIWSIIPTQAGPDGSPIGAPEILRGFKVGIEESYFGQKSLEGVPQLKPTNIRKGNLFEKLRSAFDEYGPVAKGNFGPAGLITISDPVMVRHIFSSQGRYDKGPLSVVAGDIFGKGLITASDREVWTSRRRVVSPGFHSRWLKGLVNEFAQFTSKALVHLETYAKYDEAVDMESLYLNLSLDIVGQAVFGVDFGAISQPQSEPQSPIVRAVYRVLNETTVRSQDPISLLLVGAPDQIARLSPQAKEFRESLALLDEALENAITNARSTQSSQDVSELQTREGGTLLQFLVDYKGQDVEDVQLRDDLRTLLIAGHETVASILTWATFELSRNPAALKTAQQEVAEVLGGRAPTYEDIKALKYLRLVITETLRMYPAPVALFRRALAKDTLPQGGSSGPVPITRGTLIAIQTGMLHRNPQCYNEPDHFVPERWTTPFGSESSASGWSGYDPARVTGLYPTEIATDFCFIPFGAGEFKCIGDQFAMMESVVVLAMLLQQFEFTPLQKSLEEVGLDPGATIHTKNGLLMRLKRQRR